MSTLEEQVDAIGLDLQNFLHGTPRTVKKMTWIGKEAILPHPTRTGHWIALGKTPEVEQAFGTELHVELREIIKQVRELPDSSRKKELMAKLKAITSTMLVKVFKVAADTEYANLHLVGDCDEFDRLYPAT